MYNQMKNMPIQRFMLITLGAASGVGWISITLALDYFSAMFTRSDPEFKFPIAMHAAIFIMDILHNKVPIILTLNIGTAMVINSLILLIIPLIAALYPNEHGLRYVQNKGCLVIIFLVFILGGLSTIQINTMMTICDELDIELFQYCHFGQWLAAIVLCVVKLSLINQTHLGQGAFIMGCVAATWNILSLFIFIRFQQSNEAWNYYRSEKPTEPNESPRLGDIEMAHLRFKKSTSEVQVQESIDEIHENLIGGSSELARKLELMNLIQRYNHLNKITEGMFQTILFNSFLTSIIVPGYIIHGLLTQPQNFTLQILVIHLGTMIGLLLSGSLNLEYAQIVLILFARCLSLFYYFFANIQYQIVIMMNLVILAITHGLISGKANRTWPHMVPGYAYYKAQHLSRVCESCGMLLGSITAILSHTLKA